MMHTEKVCIRLDQLCRLCAQRCREVVPIFSTHGKDRDLAMKINTILPIVVMPDDELPLQVCLRCLLWMETMHELRENCREANMALQLLLLKEKQQKETAGVEDRIDREPEQDSRRTETQPAMGFSSIPDQQSSDHQTLWCHDCHLLLPDGTSFVLHQKLLHRRYTTTCRECCLFFSSTSQLDAHMNDLHSMKGISNDADGCSSNNKFTSSNRNLVSPTFNNSDEINYNIGNDIVHVHNGHNESQVKQCSPVKNKNINLISEVTNCQSPALHRNKVRNLSLVQQFRLPNNDEKVGEVAAGKCKARGEKKYTKLTEFKCKSCQKVYPLEEKSAYLKHCAVHSKEAAAKRKAEKLKISTIVCDYCDLHFVAESSKLSHMRLKHREYKPYMCDQCGKRFHVKASVLNHVTSHQAERPYSCNICDKTFSSRNYADFHRKYSHSEKVSCPVCSTKMQPTRMKSHMLKHYKERRFQCKECCESFFSRENLKEHMKTHSDTLYECEICGLCSSSDENLYSHKLQHIDHTTQNYICPVKSCNMTFVSKDSIIFHCERHSIDDFKLLKKFSTERNMAFFCWYCKKPFRNLPVYLEHVKNHRDVRNELLIFSCNFCHKNFSDDKILLKHLEQHPEAFSFHCRHCKERFITSESRRFHEGVTHGGRVICRTCNKTYCSISRRNVHEAVHSRQSGHRMFGCEHCGMRFTIKQHLTQHYMVHSAEKKFKCGTCLKCFKLKSDLKKHMMIHLNIKAYRCRHCNFSSNRLKDITEHKFLNHDDLSGSDSDQDCNNILFLFK